VDNNSYPNAVAGGGPLVPLSPPPLVRGDCGLGSYFNISDLVCRVCPAGWSCGLDVPISLLHTAVTVLVPYP
jgi:hypothetical protein